jgi:hypothetical protein
MDSLQIAQSPSYRLIRRPAKRRVSLKRPGEIPDLAAPGFLPGEICF